MSDHASDGLELRILVLAPTFRDALTTRDTLAAVSVDCFPCRTIAELCREAERGAGAAIVTAEAVVGDKNGVLTAYLRSQPTWSDFPLIVLTPPGTDSPRLLHALAAVGHTTLMKRPVPVSTLVSTVQTALRDRQRQYAVRSHVAEHQRVAELLKDADRRKDEFIALLAHELRNPLAPIRNGLQLIRLAEGDMNSVAQARAMMDRQLGHLVRLVDDLLDVSRINRNKMQLRRCRLHLSEVINNAVETARPEVESRRHELKVSLPPAPISLNGDLTRLAQVFSNLLTNSAKYTDPGGRIWLTAESRQGEAIVSVRDTGIGIPAEALPTIFDMFSQVDRGIERSAGGLGIGLALVKGLVEMHGGKVSAMSEGRGKGTTFIVTLPALTSEPAVTTTIPDNGEPIAASSGRRILVVDDNYDSATSMATILTLWGNEVTTAHDGLEAVATAERFQPEVILMDVGMPRLNGLDATRRIRERPWGKTIAVIALTGWGQEADVQRSKKAGCNGHLVKPVSMPDLRKALDAVRPVSGSPCQGSIQK